jgi:hypothetical protein
MRPMQPIVVADDGVVRFEPNQIVRFLLDNGGFDLNQLTIRGFPEVDWEQFAQLIGYSVDGFADLSYASDEVVTKADEIAAEVWRTQKEKNHAQP